MTTFYDLFCGIGGFRLGLERAGYSCVGSCEIDKSARTIYERHFGEEPDLDAFKLDVGAMPDFDILCGGFPCQAFSLAGKRLGFEDTRGTLFFEIARIARQKRPSLLFLENVEGLLFHDEGRTFGTILLALDELGYDAEWQVMHGSDFLPQRRERVFIIGHLRDRGARQIFPLGTPEKENTESQGIAHCIDANYWKGIDNHGQRTCIAIATANTKANGRRMKDTNEPAFTLTVRADLGIYDGLRMRNLTPLECERLQGFPDGWTEGLTDQNRYRCLGNAVMPPVITYISKQFQI